MTGEPVMLSLLGFGFLCLMGLILWFCVFRMSVLSFVEWDYFWGVVLWLSERVLLLLCYKSI